MATNTAFDKPVQKPANWLVLKPEELTHKEAILRIRYMEREQRAFDKKLEKIYKLLEQIMP